jgi:hypothetical protein
VAFATRLHQSRLQLEEAKVLSHTVFDVLAAIGTSLHGSLQHLHPSPSELDCHQVREYSCAFDWQNLVDLLQGGDDTEIDRVDGERSPENCVCRWLIASRFRVVLEIV